MAVIQMARKSRKNNSGENSYIRVYRTAIYARLSRETRKVEKIENQIDYVKSYIEKRPYFQLVDVYADNGYTGTDFNRPEFQRLMEDIRNRKIDCIIVKDLSRFAREHIGAGDYLNNIFPFLDVRFIAINDGYDNINIQPEEYFLTSFKNLAHAHFAAETSRKVAMAKRRLQEQGKFIGSIPKFGYSIDPNDCHKLIINEEQAAVVREIYTRAADGESISSIHSDITNRENAVFKSNKGFVYKILCDEIYIGTLIQRTKMTSFYKGEKTKKIPKSEQLRFENAVPSIISVELWNKARQVIEERKSKQRKEKTPQGSDEP
jgi:DNA invertase Pin-like site-specific DNA recombinase